MSIPLGNRNTSNKVQTTTVASTDSIVMRSNSGSDLQIEKQDFINSVVSRNIDGGDARSIYLPTQKIDGGVA